MAAVAIGRDREELVTIDLSTGAIRDLAVSGWKDIGQPAWSPDGRTIFAPAEPRQSGSLQQIWAFDALTGAHRPLTSGSGSADYSTWSLSATASGDLFAITLVPDLSLWVTDRSRSPKKIQALRGEGSNSVIWVDGRVVTSNDAEIMVHDLEGQTSTKLRSHSTMYRHLARCGPGNVAYWSSDTHRPNYIAITDVLTGATRDLTNGPSENNPQCTADGSTLVFQRWVQGDRSELVRKSLKTGESAVLTQLSFDHPLISPDGAKVLMQIPVDRNDPYGWAQIIPIAGGVAKRLKMPFSIEGDAVWAWSPDGKAIMCERKENGVGNIWWIPLDGKPPKQLTAFDSDLIFAFDVAPDGRIAMSRGQWVGDVVHIGNVKDSTTQNQ
jgi:Tol biopolymer transport system component